MRKLFTILVISLATCTSLFADEFTHWSAVVEGGASQFDGDTNQKYNQLNPGTDVLFTGGANVEYTFTPFWGLGLEYQYLPYKGHSCSTQQHLNYGNFDFKGSSNEVSLFASINLTNLFNVYRKYWRFNVYANAGLGIAFYNTTVSNWVKDNTAVTISMTPEDVKDGRSLVMPVSLLFEYNISKPLALGLNLQYRMHMKDNFEGEAYVRGIQNDNEALGTLNLRYKFQSDKKEGHIRNVAPDRYRLIHSSDKGVADKLDSLEKRVKKVEDTIANNILPRLGEVERKLSTEPDADGDGVPDWRDKEPNTPKDAYVNYWGVSLPKELMKAAEYYEELANPKEEAINYDMSVYFAFDKKNLTKKSIQNIAVAAEKLKANPNLKVELRGYCDYPGSNSYNLKLGTDRGIVVKQELVNKHGINPNRITLNPQGRMSNPPNATQKNRRTDFVFSK